MANSTNNSNNSRVFHTIPPIFDENSGILVLGTLPSPQSRKTGFYYGHPQNRFWRVISLVLDYPEILSHTKISKNEKIKLLLDNKIALWDVLQSAEIEGAADSTIKSEVPNNLNIILKAAPIKSIFATGAKAASLYRKHHEKTTGIPIVSLPSTSPANCKFNLEALVKAYSVIKEYIK